MVVIGGLGAIVVTSPGWENVKETFFSWPDFKRVFPDVLAGFWLDVKMFCVIEVVVLILGLAIALVRTSRAPALFPLRLMGAVYTDVLRGVPTILLVFLVGLRGAGARARGPADRPGAARRRRAGALLLGLRGRGLPGGDRLDPPEPARPRRWRSA